MKCIKESLVQKHSFKGVLQKKVFLKVSQNSQENICVGKANVFPMNFVKFLKTPILQNNCGELLLSVTLSLFLCLFN